MRTYAEQLEDIILRHLLPQAQDLRDLPPEYAEILDRLKYRKRLAKLLQQPEKPT